MTPVEERLDAWMLTRYIAWADPDQNVEAKVRLHIPKDLCRQIGHDELDDAIRASQTRTIPLRDRYADLVCDATLVWGLANASATRKMDSSAEAFASALLQCKPENQTYVNATRNLYLEVKAPTADDVYDRFLLLLSTAMLNHTDHEREDSDEQG